MTISDDLIDLLSILVYGSLAVAALRLHRRVAQPSSRWVAASFVALASVPVLSLTDLVLDEAGMLFWLIDVVRILAVLAFPFFLLRFAVSLGALGPIAGWVGLWAFTVISALTVWTRFVDLTPATQNLYVLAALAYWAGLAIVTAAGLLLAGSGQPAGPRIRTRWLAAALVLILSALLLAGLSDAEEGSLLRLLANLIAWISAGMFLLGFAPPAMVRRAWRGSGGLALRNAEKSLMAATDRDAVLAAILPPVAALSGGGAAAFFDLDGHLVATHGPSADTLNPAAAPDPKDGGGSGIRGVTLSADRMVVDLQSGTLVASGTPLTGFFGDDEIDLLVSTGVLVDLAMERLDAFERQQEALAALEMANEELQSLVYGISHDLRNPLVTVLGYVDILQSDAAEHLDPQSRHHLERIAASASYMDALIEDLLELSRVGRTSTEVGLIEIGSMIRDVSIEVGRDHPGLTVDVASMPVLIANVHRIRQLVTNLIANAARHGGRETLHVRVSATTMEDGAVELSFADDGVGVAEEYRDRVFGLFERLSPDRAGTGIGLTMCRRIVSELGGEIRFADADVGADIRVTLPASAVANSLAAPIAGGDDHERI